MQITQETAILIDILATAASKIGSTEASAELLKRIEELASSDSVTIPRIELEAYRLATENADLFRSQLQQLGALYFEQVQPLLGDDEPQAFNDLIAPWAPAVPVELE